MAIQTNLGVSGGGIQHPALKNNWALLVSSLDDKYNDVLRMQAVSCKLNMIKGTLELVFEQMLDGKDQLEAIELMARHTDCIVAIQLLDGNANIGCEYTFVGECVDHEMELDYSKSECVKHVLKFKSDKFWTRDNDPI